MKQKVQHIALTALAFVLFFIGGGVNAVQACCSSCFNNIVFIGECHPQDEKQLATKLSGCCLGKTENSTNLSIKAENKLQQTTCCVVERVVLDLENTTNTGYLLKPLLPVSLQPSPSLVLSLQYAINIQSGSLEKECRSIPILPRDYLALIRVLII